QVVSRDLDADALAVLRHRQGHGDLDVLERPAFLAVELVRDLPDLALDGPPVVYQLDHLDLEVAAPFGREEQLRGEVEGLADTSGKVRHAEAREELAVLELLGRE